MAKNRKVTIRDVAEQAGFSVSTVSHVLNGTRFVEKGTREKILRAIDELHYRPNILAQGLKGKGSKTIGVIISDIRQGYFAEVIKSIESRANERGFNVMLCDSEDSAEKEEFYVDIMLRKGVDGLIIAPVDTGQTFQELRRSRTPCVQVDRKLEGFPADFVGIDNRAAAAEATRRLFDQGYRGVGFLGYHSRIYTMAMRREGYRQEVREAGGEDLSAEVPHLIHGAMSSTITEWMENHPRADALVCGNDDICFEVLSVLENQGREVPGEMGIISFDDTRWFSLLKCPVTAIQQPTVMIGRAAVDLLLRRVAGARDAYREELFDTELLVRGSCSRCTESRPSIKERV
jgi:LacI family transcriptional regulator